MDDRAAIAPPHGLQVASTERAVLGHGMIRDRCPITAVELREDEVL